jgi:hypothetical protein
MLKAPTLVDNSADLCSGRDVDELTAMKDEIVKKDLLKFTMDI